jgi:hypothetical protein
LINRQVPGSAALLETVVARQQHLTPDRLAQFAVRHVSVAPQQLTHVSDLMGSSPANRGGAEIHTPYEGMYDENVTTGRYLMP